MGDLLKAKIQQRPDKQQLVRQHILEDVGDVDRSLAERQRMLVKCRLADSLNTQLAHRPGPLELIKKNILHTDEPIERAVKGVYDAFYLLYIYLRMLVGEIEELKQSIRNLKFSCFDYIFLHYSTPFTRLMVTVNLTLYRLIRKCSKWLYTGPLFYAV